MNKLWAFLALVLIVQLCSVTTVSARSSSNIRYVAPGVACTGFSSCFASVQDAVDASESGDEIDIAAASYTAVTTKNGVQQIAFISKSLTLRGGYDADFSMQDYQANLTTLDAQGQGHVLYIDGTGNTGMIIVSLDGLQLTGGVWSNSQNIAYNDIARRN